jgi:hypothetical protein
MRAKKEAFTNYIYLHWLSVHPIFPMRQLRAVNKLKLPLSLMTNYYRRTFYHGDHFTPLRNGSGPFICGWWRWADRIAGQIGCRYRVVGWMKNGSSGLYYYRYFDMVCQQVVENQV